MAPPLKRRKATSAEGEGCWNVIPTDAFVQILLLLPVVERWRARLVCRRWRDVIHEHTPAPERLARPMPLAFIMNYESLTVFGRVSASVYAIDDLERGHCTELCRIFPAAHGKTAVADDDQGRRSTATDAPFDTMMVGTSNGLLCLCDETKPGGLITLVNPLTGEAMDVPPLPDSGQSGWHEAYSFGYEPTTGQYKIVHVPCYFGRRAYQEGVDDVVNVFTVCEDASSSSWRDVPVPAGAIRGRDRDDEAGVISVDGVTYWMSMDCSSIVSFDLKEERVMFTLRLPVDKLPGRKWLVTEVHGRPGIISAASVVTEEDWPPETNEVLVLDGAGEDGDERRWTRLYSMDVDGRSRGIGPTHPHFLHDGYFLTSTQRRVFAQKSRNAGRWRPGEVRKVRINQRMPMVEMSEFGSCGFIHGMFNYVRRLRFMGLPWGTGTRTSQNLSIINL